MNVFIFRVWAYKPICYLRLVLVLISIKFDRKKNVCYLLRACFVLTNGYTLVLQMKLLSKEIWSKTQLPIKTSFSGALLELLNSRMKFCIKILFSEYFSSYVPCVYGLSLKIFQNWHSPHFIKNVSFWVPLLT